MDGSAPFGVVNSQTFNKCQPGRKEKWLFTGLFIATLLPTAPQYFLTGFTLLWLLGSRRWQAWKTIEQPFYGQFLFGLLGFSAVHVGLLLATGFSAEQGFMGAAYEVYHLVANTVVRGALIILAFLIYQRSDGDLYALKKAILLLLYVNTVYCLMQFIFGFDWVRGFGVFLGENRLNGSFYRVSGFTGHPLTLAYSALLLTTLAAVRFSQSNSSRRLFWGQILILGAVTVILTQSRWPIAVLVLVGLSQMRQVWNKPEINRWLTSVIAFSLFAVLAVFVWKRFAASQDLLSHYQFNLSRVVFWKVHLQIFLENPFAGIGYWHRESGLADYYMQAGYGTIEKQYQAHNLFLQVLADSGIVGFFGLLMLFSGIFRAARVFAAKGDVSLLYVLAVVCLSALMQNTMRDSEYVYSLWVVVGLAFLTRGDPQIEKSHGKA